MSCVSLATCLGLLALPGAVPGSEPARATFAGEVAPFVARYCQGCHGGAKPKGSLALDRFKDQAAVLKDRAAWEKVRDVLRSGEMPPQNKPQPTREEVNTVLGWLESEVLRPECGLRRDPGGPTLRRLNRAEYDNTIRDLFGVKIAAADDFPSDDVGYGFDNIGDVLSVSPLLAEKYLTAAEKVVRKAFQSEEVRKRILIRKAGDGDSRAAARDILRAFADRAYRRPVRDDELKRLLRLVELAEQNGDDFETGIRLALQAVLVSPHFLFRVELDREPQNPDAVHPLNGFEVASRLSYFLWSSLPDDELFGLARQGKLEQPAVLETQVRRMLKDHRARALVDNFAGQWLQLRNVAICTPDPARFPDFDEPLRAAMLRETEMFFESLLREDRSVLDFLDADYSYLNERLARHYGIAGVKGDQFRRVSLAGTPRGGVLTQASVLTVTSNPTRTSPVKRGKWILENLLGAPPPAPPPGVEQLKDDARSALTGTLRQRMVQHRANPACATCHQRMDPLGFGLENFDAVGAWRTREGDHPIDPSGVLPGGQSFQGPAELRAVLRTRKDAFCRCLTEKMLTYALGRGLERSDRCVVDETANALARKDYKISALVLAVVRSDPFLMRRGKRGTP